MTFDASILASLALIVVGVLLMLQPSKPPAGVVAPRDGQSAPSSTKPSEKDLQEYVVAPDLPRYISIPAINVSGARVIHLGLTKGNQIASPDNILMPVGITAAPSLRPGAQCLSMATFPAGQPTAYFTT